MSYELIETIEVGAGGAASIEFTSIPQDGVDLLLVTSLRAGDSAVVSRIMRLEISGDTATNYAFIDLDGNGTAADSGSGTSQTGVLMGRAVGTSSTANTFSNSSCYISNYTSTSNKSISVDSVTENNATEAFHGILANVHTSSSAVTSLRIRENSNQSILTGSTASLYKIS